jgi:hypothetical protein
LHAALPRRNRRRAIVNLTQAARNGGIEMTGGSMHGRRPGQPDDEYPDFLWPGDKDDQDARSPEEAGQLGGDGRGVAPGRPVPFPWPAPPVPYPAKGARERRRRAIALTVTAAVAVGFGAGAVLAYRNAQAGSPLPAAASQNGGLTPGQSEAPAGPRSVTEMEVLGRVTSVSNGSITIGGGPVRAVRATVTSATRFTGTVRTLAAVRVGNVVEAQIIVTNGTARLVSLQDPPSES